MTAVVKTIEDVRAKWNARQQQLAEIGLSAKDAQYLHVENRKLDILSRLKVQCGPFTGSDEIDAYLNKRMKNEVTYARNASKSLPVAHCCSVS